MNAPATIAQLSTRQDAAFEIQPHPTHPRLKHLVLDETALAGFLADVRHIDVQNLEYVPFMRFQIALALRQRLGDDFAATVNQLTRDRRHGGFTVGLQGLTRDSDEYVKFATAVGFLLGPANHDAMSGKYYARFQVRHTDSSDSYLRQAYRLFTLHTDGTYVTESTDWLLMMKFSELNAVGGESRFLHLDDWTERDAFVNHPLGARPLLYKSPGSKNVGEVTNRPLFFHGEFGLSICFIDQFVQPSDAAEAAFLYELSKSMEETAGTQELALPTGDLVVLNNYFYLHGRAPFQQNEGLQRELLRLRGTFAG